MLLQATELKRRAAELQDEALNWNRVLERALRKNRRLRLLDRPMLLRFIQHCSLLHFKAGAMDASVARIASARQALFPYILLWYVRGPK
jgi:hypothetical protein